MVSYTSSAAIVVSLVEVFADQYSVQELLDHHDHEVAVSVLAALGSSTGEAKRAIVRNDLNCPTTR